MWVLNRDNWLVETTSSGKLFHTLITRTDVTDDLPYVEEYVGEGLAQCSSLWSQMKHRAGHHELNGGLRRRMRLLICDWQTEALNDAKMIQIWTLFYLSAYTLDEVWLGNIFLK